MEISALILNDFLLQFLNECLLQGLLDVQKYSSADSTALRNYP
jgi:hypothetical protein